VSEEKAKNPAYLKGLQEYLEESGKDFNMESVAEYVSAVFNSFRDDMKDPNSPAFNMVKPYILNEELTIEKLKTEYMDLVLAAGYVPKDEIADKEKELENLKAELEKKEDELGRESKLLERKAEDLKAYENDLKAREEKLNKKKEEIEKYISLLESLPDINPETLPPKNNKMAAP